mmetsp:Transcript_16787/g.37258  ORF Transcript_16787/g.37258 Transcript_16787/m.37258 type:complete len:343 (+) Transcript_16787:145-1173(+)
MGTQNMGFQKWVPSVQKWVPSEAVRLCSALQEWSGRRPLMLCCRAEARARYGGPSTHAHTHAYNYGADSLAYVCALPISVVGLRRLDEVSHPVRAFYWFIVVYPVPRALYRRQIVQGEEAFETFHVAGSDEGGVRALEHEGGVAKGRVGGGSRGVSRGGMSRGRICISSGGGSVCSNVSVVRKSRNLIQRFEYLTQVEGPRKGLSVQMHIRVHEGTQSGVRKGVPDLLPQCVLAAEPGESFVDLLEAGDGAGHAQELLSGVGDWRDVHHGDAGKDAAVMQSRRGCHLAAHTVPHQVRPLYAQLLHSGHYVRGHRFVVHLQLAQRSALAVISQVTADHFMCAS